MNEAKRQEKPFFYLDIFSFHLFSFHLILFSWLTLPIPSHMNRQGIGIEG